MTQASGKRRGRGLLPFEITEIVDREFKTPRFKSGCSEIYLANAREFIVSKLANKLAHSRRKQGMFDALEREGDWDEDTDLSLGASGKRVLKFANAISHVDFFL